ncbi:hypothetical protein PHISCL_05985 [Aspergillus sclerotialis]|uniref:Uncharacterized protein n=1 Tax=Aspergillus sclerotialis TaxID=2070753 RepID=A0A3A2ZQV3_9EURO|nr:hypothetical protein PHISCL_05985 [Aspergillus sclerotialis]
MADSSDLRHTGTQIKRVHDRKAKWAYGSRDARTQATGRNRPAVPVSHYILHSRTVKRNNQANLNHASRAAKQSLRLDLLEFLRESAPEPEDADECGEYEYDDYDYDDYEEDTEPEVVVPSPGEDVSGKIDVAGHAILADAVNKAVEKFESKETEKIAKEYEIVRRGSEASVDGVATTEGDFELVKV